MSTSGCCGRNTRSLKRLSAHCHTFESHMCLTSERNTPSTRVHRSVNRYRSVPHQRCGARRLARLSCVMLTAREYLNGICNARDSSRLYVRIPFDCFRLCINNSGLYLAHNARQHLCASMRCCLTFMNASSSSSICLSDNHNRDC